MAIWQVRFIFVPKKALSLELGSIPCDISMETAENYRWWENNQPFPGFEQEISLVLPPAKPWSKAMRTWGEEESNDACVLYEDESQTSVEEIAFRIDAREVSRELLIWMCEFAKRLDCVFLTSDYSIIMPDVNSVMLALQCSEGAKFVADPTSTLLHLNNKKLNTKVDHITKDLPKK